MSITSKELCSRAKASKLTGKWAESIVCEQLERRGWIILARNARSHGYELDIVAARGSSITFFEVKCRFKADFYEELQNFETLVGVRKRRAMRRGAIAFLATLKETYDHICFDLVLLLRSKNQVVIRHYRNIDN